jgi:hypothetical protein
MLIHLKDFKSFSLFENMKVEKIEPAAYNMETVTELPYMSYIGENRNKFLKKLIKISEELGIKPQWLLHTIFHESRFDTKYKDKISGQVGLLSFLPSVLKNFINPDTGKNYSPNDVLEMSNVDQLDLVRAFYKTWLSEMNLNGEISPGDFASITFYPEAIRKDWKWEFPSYIVDTNVETFKKFPSGSGKSKKNYYEYIDQVFNSDEEQDDNNNYILGNFSGAFADPQSYREKKPLEYYRGVLDSIEDLSLNQEIQQQDLANTEKNKQVNANTVPLGINVVK